MLAFFENSYESTHSSIGSIFPAIYITTPCMNSAETIDWTIASVLSQAGDFSIHYTIQDGGSTDGTLKKLAIWENRLRKGLFPLFCEDIVFTYNTEPDKNMYDAVCKGFASMCIPPRAFMTWINSDDILFPEAFSFIMKIQDLQNISWVAGAGAVMNQGIPVWQGDRWLSSEVIKRGLCDGKHWEFVQQEGSFFRKDLWDKSECSEKIRKFKLAGDWMLWRLFAQHEEFYQAPRVLGAFVKRAGQLSEQMNVYRDEINSVLTKEKRFEELSNLPRQLTRKLLQIQDPSGEIQIIDDTSEKIGAFFQQRALEWGK